MNYTESKFENSRVLELLPKNQQITKKIIIFVHGFGADCEDLISLAPILQKEFTDCAFFSINAPHKCTSLPFGYEWFSLKDRSKEAILKNLPSASDYLCKFIDYLKEKYELNYNDIFLFGFSQGAMLSSYIANEKALDLAGVILASGVMCYDKKTSNNTKYCIIHGKEDEVILAKEADRSEEFCKKHNIYYKKHIIENLTHSINSYAIKKIIDFIKTI